jgi:hypothetical protein
MAACKSEAERRLREEDVADWERLPDGALDDERNEAMDCAGGLEWNEAIDCVGGLEWNERAP